MNKKEASTNRVFRLAVKFLSVTSALEHAALPASSSQESPIITCGFGVMVSGERSRSPEANWNQSPYSSSSSWF